MTSGIANQTGSSRATRIITEVIAKRLTLLAAGLSVYAGVITAVAIGLGDPGTSYFGLIDISIFLALAYGVYRKSRTAAIILFAYHLLNRVTVYLQTAELGDVFNVATITYGVIFFLGILGAFAHHAIAAERRRL